MKAKGLSRVQKRKVNERQKNIYRAISEYSRTAELYGEHIALYQQAKRMFELNLLSEKDYIEIVYVTIINECLYQINMNCPKEKQELDTSKLYAGLCVPNYRKLCELLGEKPTTGEAKQIQEKLFLRFFDYEKLACSNEIYILEVYDEPLPEAEQKKYRKSAFVNQMKILLLAKLLLIEPDNKGNIIFTTSYGNLLRKLELVNGLFFDNPKYLSDFFVDKFTDMFPDITITEQPIANQLKAFRLDVMGKLKGAITYALNELEKDHMIHFERYNVIIENGLHRKASFEEEILIQTCKQTAAFACGYRNASIASNYNPTVFRKYLNEQYEKQGWNGVYFQLQIGTNIKNLYRNISDFTAYTEEQTVFDMTSDKLIQYRLSFNESLCNELMKKVESSKAKTIKQIIDTIKAKQPDLAEGLTDEDMILIYGLSDCQPVQWFENVYSKQLATFIEYIIQSDSARSKEVWQFISNQHQRADNMVNELYNFIDEI